MKTVVFQSYRTVRQPDWIKACMASVRDWASANGFEYRFIDDSFLDLVPAWYRDRCRGEICPVTDLARLVMARDLLADGWDRAVWVDADILVFDPGSLAVNSPGGSVFCLELWPSVDGDQRLRCDRHVNNSVSVFPSQDNHLGFLIDACLRIASTKQSVGKLDVSTHFLTRLAGILPMPLLTNVGMFSPLLVCDIASGAERFVPDYAALLPTPLACANLCHSLVGEAMQGWRADDAACSAVVERCLSTKGSVVNRHLTGRTC